MSGLTGKMATPDAHCPTCGLEVGGYALGVTSDGRTTWDRPTKLEIGPSGTEVRVGGLTHVEGGERCIAAASVLAKLARRLGPSVVQGLAV